MPRPTNEQMELNNRLHDQGLRQCSNCGEVKPVGEYHRQKHGRNGLRGRCKPCQTDQNRQSYHRDPASYIEKQKARDTRTDGERKSDARKYQHAHRARTLYGITPEEYYEYLEHPCAICGKESECLDHCHGTGRVREALCKKCNSGIGFLGDDPAVVQRAVDYLVRHTD